MKLTSENIKLLGLSNKDVRVLNAIIEGANTPLLISEAVRVSRSTVYDIILDLSSRGLIKSYDKKDKKYWKIPTKKEVEKAFFNAKKEILDISKGSNEITGLGDSVVTVHRGSKAIIKAIDDIIKNHSKDHIYMIQGNSVATGWERIYTAERMNNFNKAVKKYNIITELIVPFGLFHKQTDMFGKQWAIDFEGRDSVTNAIEEEYFNHAGQIFIFKNSLYLMAMNEEVIIEVHNSAIQKLILSLFNFIQHNSDKIDSNAILRKIIAEE